MSTTIKTTAQSKSRLFGASNPAGGSTSDQGRSCGQVPRAPPLSASCYLPQPPPRQRGAGTMASDQPQVSDTTSLSLAA
ncbi:hypothetical protein OC835_004287 [Tilletia horrida]|nr:hypothetical protein OC835_004287 [Tilletia horrida]